MDRPEGGPQRRYFPPVAEAADQEPETENLPHRRQLASPSRKTGERMASGEQAPHRGPLSSLLQPETESGRFDDQREDTQPQGEAIPQQRSQANPFPSGSPLQPIPA